MPRGPSSSSRRVSVYHSRLTTNVLITGAKLNLLQRKQHEKDAAIIRATAEKESADLIREASKGERCVDTFHFYRLITFYLNAFCL